jgi:hypothetical protein
LGSFKEEKLKLALNNQCASQEFEFEEKKLTIRAKINKS